MKNSPSSAKSPTDPPSTKPASLTIEVEERVRYSETDQMGVAHNKNYFEWFEVGRTEFCRRQGLPYRAIERTGFFLVVVEAFCKYKKPLHYDESFLIRVSLREATPKKFIFDYELRTKEKQTLIATGYTIHIVTNAHAEVSALPEDILKKIVG